MTPKQWDVGKYGRNRCLERLKWFPELQLLVRLLNSRFLELNQGHGRRHGVTYLLGPKEFGLLRLTALLLALIANAISGTDELSFFF